MAESPPFAYELAAQTTAKAVYTVTGAPLTSGGLWSLEVYPQEVELRAHLNGELQWEILMATVMGQWKTNQGDRSISISDLTFVLPLSEKNESDTVVPDWVKTICGEWLGLLGELLEGPGTPGLLQERQQEAARKVTREMFAGLMPGDTGTNMADEVADKVLTAVRRVD